ncbi:MAG: holo-ACP synthase [Cellulosilyticaceae bacterium]
MIRGIGTDIIEIERVDKAMNRTSSFREKLFREEERALLEQLGYPRETIAGRFAAKEAVSKALGTGFRKFGPSDIVILKSDFGQPYVRLYDGAKARFEEMGGTHIHLSISHCQTYAVAYATIEGRVECENSNQGADKSN